MKSASLQLFKAAGISLKVPLFLTIGRLIISPIFVVFYIYYQGLDISLKVLPFILLILLVISELSDFFDGYIARRWNLVTELGKILDPMADSIARLTVLFSFTQGLIQLPMLLVFVFLYREAMISTLRTVCALRGVTLAARKSGKMKTFIQAISVFVILLLMIPYAWGGISLHQLQVISLAIISIAAVYTVYSGIEYILANRSYIKQAWSSD